MEGLANMAVLAIICIASLYLIYTQKFSDTLGQRLGLCVTCFGAAMQFVTSIQVQDVPRPAHLLAYGCGIYLLATVFKYWRGK